QPDRQRRLRADTSADATVLRAGDRVMQPRRAPEGLAAESVVAENLAAFRKHLAGVGTDGVCLRCVDARGRRLGAAAGKYKRYCGDRRSGAKSEGGGHKGLRWDDSAFYASRAPRATAPIPWSTTNACITTRCNSACLKGSRYSAASAVK